MQKKPRLQFERIMYAYYTCQTYKAEDLYNFKASSASIPSARTCEVHVKLLEI